MSTTALVRVDQAAVIEADPVEFMTLALTQVTGWLKTAERIDDVREWKSQAVGYEALLRQKGMAVEAQLAAAEIQRRCERRIGELVKHGQEVGEIRTSGDGGPKDPSFAKEGSHAKPGPNDFFNGNDDKTHAYAMAAATDEEFDGALAEAREEGNISRANVVRKVKGEPAKAPDRSEWHHKTRRIDSNRILSTLAQELDAAASGLDLIVPDDLDPDLVAECTTTIKTAVATINRHLRRIQ